MIKLTNALKTSWPLYTYKTDPWRTLDSPLTDPWLTDHDPLPLTNHDDWLTMTMTRYPWLTLMTDRVRLHVQWREHATLPSTVVVLWLTVAELLPPLVGWNTQTGQIPHKHHTDPTRTQLHYTNTTHKHRINSKTHNRPNRLTFNNPRSSVWLTRRLRFRRYVSRRGLRYVTRSSGALGHRNHWYVIFFFLLFLISLVITSMQLLVLLYSI